MSLAIITEESIVKEQVDEVTEYVLRMYTEMYEIEEEIKIPSKFRKDKWKDMDLDEAYNIRCYAIAQGNLFIYEKTQIKKGNKLK